MIFIYIGSHIVDYIYKNQYIKPEEINFNNDFSQGMILLIAAIPEILLGLIFGYLLAKRISNKINERT